MRDSDSERVRVMIMGAGGRDFHNFNTFYRMRSSYEVVAFSASQIPYIENRTYPPELAGPNYPEGIPILPESELVQWIEKYRVQQVTFSYSDIAHEELMDKASLVLSQGADFSLLGPGETMLPSRLPVISVCAVRTGCGKSVITKKISGLLKKKGVQVTVIRHPMAYCSFEPFQRFSEMTDVERGTCTIEEREEFEPLVEMGVTVFAGVDYERVLREAERESEIIIWDGGNNDFPFVRPDWEIVLLDALRPGHEKLYYPGEVNLRRADLLVVTKVNEAEEEAIQRIEKNISQMNPLAEVLRAASIVRLDRPEWIEGKRVLVIEDGPTMTHGGMSYGAGSAATRGLARELVDPRPYAAGSLKEVFRKYPHLTRVLPAMGYSEGQVRDLEETIRQVPCDAVVIATPADLRRKLNIRQPTVRAWYDFEIDLVPLLDRFLNKKLDFS